MDLYLLRHVESEANVSGILCGQMDAEPSRVGKDQLKSLSKSAASHNRVKIFDQLIHSPLKRAKLTAEPVFQLADSIHSSELLMELDTGTYSSSLKKDFVRDIDSRAETHNLFPDFRYPGGESLLDLFERAEKFIEESLQKHFMNNSRVLIVGHHGCMSAIIHKLMGIEVKHFPCIELRNAKICHIQVNSSEGSLENAVCKIKGLDLSLEQLV